MTKSSLTHKQQMVLDYIHRYFSEYRRYPLIREVQEGCAITSYKSALDRLNALDRKGFIRRLPNKHRGIRLVRRSVPQEAASKEPALIPVG